MKHLSSVRRLDAMRLLVDWAELADSYHTWEKGLILHALVKMNRPQNVLEIGTGSAVSTLCMAVALKEVGHGHLYTVDDDSQRGDPRSRFPTVIRSHATFRRAVNRASLRTNGLLDYDVFFRELRDIFGLGSHLTFLKGHFDLGPSTHQSHVAPAFLRRPLRKPLDLVFVDYRTGLAPTLRTIAFFLPLMAPSSSILFDSESTWHPSFLAVERTIAQLNAGKIPVAILAGTTGMQRESLIQLVHSRRFQLVHFVERADQPQNSLMWIKIEPVDVFPYPLSGTFGMPDGPASTAQLSRLFKVGPVTERKALRR